MTGTRRPLGRAWAKAGPAVILGVAGAIAVPSAGQAGTPVPGAGSCPMFPADNVWNADVSGLPVDSHSAAWMASMASSTTKLHPDFGPSGDPSNPYGMPFIVVPAGHQFVNVSFQYADESDPGPYPFGPDTPIEGGSSSTGDRHAIMVDPATCTLYELYDATYSSGGSTAGSGAIWNLRSNALRPATWTSADAAGLPILPGVLRYDEVTAGSVTHAIRMTAETTDTSFIWPARHEAGARSDPSLPPMGARFRLRADFNVSSFSAPAQVVLRAMQHYGLILADNGSNWYFGGSADTNWPLSLVDELKQIPASAFEAVNESSLMVNPDSGQVRTATSAAPSTPAPAAPTTTVIATTTLAPTTTTTTTVAPTTTTTPRAVRRRHLATAFPRHQAPAGSWWLDVLLGLLGVLAVSGLAWVGVTKLRGAHQMPGQAPPPEGPDDIV